MKGEEGGHQPGDKDRKPSGEIADDGRALWQNAIYKVSRKRCYDKRRMRCSGW